MKATSRLRPAAGGAATPEKRSVSDEDKLDALRLFWQQRTAGMCVVQQGRIVLSNDRLTEILGYTPEELGRLPAKVLLPTVLEEFALRSVSQSRRESALDPMLMVQVRCKDGRIADIELFGSNAPFRGAPALLLTVVDVSARREAEQQVRESLRKFTAGLRGTVGKINEIRDPYTAGHQLRVGALAAEIGRTLGMSELAVESLLIAGEVHDVGKIGVPIEIIVLPRRLTAEEFGMVKRHASFGYEMLKDSELPPAVVDAVWHHHERLDGSGYPDGLEGDRISAEARIVAVADVVEAIASHRPYHPARGVRGALAELKKHSGTLFDRSVVRACVSLFAKGTDSRVAELYAALPR